MSKTILKYTAASAATALLAGSAYLIPVAAQNMLTETDLLPTEIATNAGLAAEANLQVTVAKIIRALLGLLGLVAVVIIMMGGFKWMTAGGSEDKVGEAKKTLAAGIIGLLIVIAAFAIANFVVGVVIGAVTK